MVNDELRDKLRRIDPALTSEINPVTAEPSRLLMEKVMEAPVSETQAKQRPPRRVGWYAFAAAAALVVVVGAVAMFNASNDPAAPPLELALPADDPMAMCIVFDVEFLRDMPVAFEGTVASVEGETVTLDVDEWFVGGDAEQVVLQAPSGMGALIGGVDFVDGGQYLITATDGTVNYCGFSGESTTEMRAAFEEAFGA